MNDVGTCESGPGVDTRRLVHIDMCLRVEQALVHSGKHIDLLTSEQVLVDGGQDIDLLTTLQVLEHGGQDRDHSVAVFEQNEEYIDFHTGGSGENVHSSRCYLSTKLR